MDRDVLNVFSLLNYLNETVMNMRENPDISNFIEQQGDTIIEAINVVTNQNRDYSLLGPNGNGHSLPDAVRLIRAIEKLKRKEIAFNTFLQFYEEWFDASLVLFTAYKTKIYNFKKPGLGIDQRFCNIVNTIKYSSIYQLYNAAMENLKTTRRENPELYNILTIKYRGWYFSGNWLDGVDGKNNSLIINRMNVLKNSIHKFEWLYERLADYRSKETLLAIMHNWLTFSMDECRKVADHSGRLCCDPDIFKFDKNEVFVDAGAYIGDTVAEFINVCGAVYKRIYVYDISAETIDLLKKNLEVLNDVVVNWKGVSDKKGQLSLSGVAAPFHGNRLVEQGGIYTVEVVTIDEDIAEPVTFLKIDVEGLDKEAILGARNHIKNDHPKIVVDSYHKLEDIVEIPLLVQSINPDYRFYLRLPAGEIHFAVGYAHFFA